MSEAEVIHQIRQIYPEVGEAAGFILGEWTSFPLYDGDDPMAWWLTQVGEFLAERPDLKETPTEPGEVRVPAGVEWGGYAVERPLAGTALCWHCQLDFPTLPDDEKEMRRLIHEKLEVVGNAILAAWRQRRKE